MFSGMLSLPVTAVPKRFFHVSTNDFCLVSPFFSFFGALGFVDQYEFYQSCCVCKLPRKLPNIDKFVPAQTYLVIYTYIHKCTHLFKKISPVCFYANFLNEIDHFLLGWIPAFQ